jgi:hypothetical protein
MTTAVSKRVDGITEAHSGPTWIGIGDRCNPTAPKGSPWVTQTRRRRDRLERIVDWPMMRSVGGTKLGTGCSARFHVELLVGRRRYAEIDAHNLSPASSPPPASCFASGPVDLAHPQDLTRDRGREDGRTREMATRGGMEHCAPIRAAAPRCYEIVALMRCNLFTSPTTIIVCRERCICDCIRPVSRTSACFVSSLFT